VHRVAADGRVPDRRPVPHHAPALPPERALPPGKALVPTEPLSPSRPAPAQAQSFAADGRARPRGAVPADGRPDDREGPSERVSGRLP